jgi:cytoskeletal protein RodZ
VDLFGGVAEAGSEDDASLDFGAADEPAHKLTGARNESSVLFSLDALTKPDAKANQKQKARDQEQEKEASAALFGDSAPNSLMNVGGGGLAALAAPDFTKPVAATVEPLRASSALETNDSEPPNKKKGGWVLLLGSLFAIAAVAGGAFVMMKKQPFAAPPAPAPSNEVKAATTPPSVEAPATSAAPEASIAPSTANAAPSTASASPNASAAAARPATTPAAPGLANKPADSTTAKKPDAAATPATPAPATPAPATEGAAFDKGAAVAALGAAAANAGSCKKPDGPTGSGKVSVTFAPSGRATATSVAGELAGTEVGGCVARLLRSAKVPPFSGDPVTVAKSFTVQ